MATASQTTVLELPHNLTNDEKLEQQNKIMKLLDTKQDLASELVSINMRHKRDKTDNEKKVGEVEAEINKVRGEIKVGVEMRKYRCNVFRDRDTRKVEYVVIDGPLAGQVVKTEDFTQDDWNAILEDSEPELPFGEFTDDEPAEQPDLRAQADLTAEPELKPDMENGQVVAGHNTDAYNMANPDSPYQHLSELTDFAPAIVPPAGEQAQDEAAEPTDATEDAGPHFDATDSVGEDYLRLATDQENEQSRLNDSDDEADEATDEDEPQPKPRVPKRPANRKK